MNRFAYALDRKTASEIQDEPGGENSVPRVSPNGSKRVIPKSKEDMDDFSSRIVVGVMVSNKDRYYNVLQAQAETWMQDVPPNQKFVVGSLDIASASR